MRRQSRSASIAIAFVILLWSEAWSGSTDLPTLGISAFSSKIPYNWACEEPQGIANAAIKKRFMDIYSWKIFVAVNWPVVSDPGHNPPWKPKATFPLLDTVTDPRENNAPDEEIPRWITWKESFEIFQKAGSQPKSDGTKSQDPQMRRLSSLTVTRLSDFAESDPDPPGTEYPLFDQNEEKVYYEIFINNVEANAIKHSGLDSIAGQQHFAASSGKVEFQPGQCTPKDPHDYKGVIELKLAWKVLDAQKDIRSRFLKRTVHIKKEGTDEGVPVEVGLVGMHIAHKTTDHMQWIWSTFEYIDNVRANDLPDGGKSKPLFYDPVCSEKDCPPNCPPTGAVKKTQLTRPKDEDITADTAQLNAEAQALLRQEKSVLQYYELIGTQYVPPGGPPGNITPASLRNTVIEPYLTRALCDNVPGYQPASSSCIGCHQRATIPSPKCVKTKTYPADFSFLLDDAPCEQTR